MKQVFAVILALLLANISYAEYIGSKFTPTTITEYQLRQAFLLNMSHWQNGTPIVIVLYEKDSLEYRNFVLTQLRMTTVTYERLIESRLIIEAANNPPIKVHSNIQLINEVINNRGAIAFIQGNLMIFDDKKCQGVGTDEVEQIIAFCFNPVTVIK